MILKCLHIYHAFFFNMFFKKLLFFLHYSISGLSDIIKTKTPGFIVFQIVLHYLLPLKSEMCHCRSGTLLPFSSSLYIPNSWIVFFLLFVFFFQQCGHLACLTVLTCQVKKKKKSTFTPDVGFVVSVKYISFICLFKPVKKENWKASSQLWSVK